MPKLKLLITDRIKTHLIFQKCNFNISHLVLKSILHFLASFWVTFVWWFNRKTVTHGWNVMMILPIS